MRKKSKAQYGSSTYVERPKNTLAMSRNYEGRLNGTDLSKSPNIQKVDKDAANKKLLALRKKQGYTTGTGVAEPVYPEAVLFPAAPEIKALGKIGNVVVDELNPLSGMMPKKVGDLADAKDWLANWYESPEVKERMRKYRKTFGDPSDELGFETLISPTEHPMQYKDYNDLFKDKGKELHGNLKGTAAGVSFGKPDQIYVDLDHYDNWDEINNVRVHEGTHLVHKNGYSFIGTPEGDDLRKPFRERRDAPFTDEQKRKLGYYGDAAEVHARMNQARHELKLSPEDEFTDAHYNQVMQKNNFYNMGDLITDKDQMIKLMNNFYTPAAVAVGAGVVANENMKKQHGGAGANQVLVEKDEFYRDSQGQLRRASKAPSHDDDVMLDGYGEYEVDGGEGGQLVDAQTVLSASYDQVGKGRAGSKKETRFALKPKRQKELAEQYDIEYTPSKKPISPSKFVERAGVQTAKTIKKYKIDPEVTGNNKYTKATQAANDAQIVDLPTLDDLYDIAFVEQEKQRGAVGRKKQYGGSTYVNKPRKLRPLSQKEIDSKYNGSKEGQKWLVDSFAKEEYPEVSYVTDKFARPDGRPNYNPITGGIHIPNNSEDNYTNDLVAELAHVDQNRRVSDFGMMGNVVRDVGRNIFKGNTSPQITTYEQKGTQENEAHTEIEPVIKRKYDDFNLRLQLPEYRDEFLRDKLTKLKKQYGGIPESLDGLYEYPDQPVVVPSGDITMDGIDYPVDAYDADSGEYLDEMQPDEQYNFDAENVLEIPKAQDGYSASIAALSQRLYEAKTPAQKERIQKIIDSISVYNPKTDVNKRPFDPLAKPKVGSKYPVRMSEPSDVVEDPYVKVVGGEQKLQVNRDGQLVDQTGAVWTKKGEQLVPTKQKGVAPRRPTTYKEYTENPADMYTVRKGDWASNVAPMFGLSTDELVQLNPQLKNPDQIDVGQRLNIRKKALAEPVDRMSEIEGLQELPQEVVQAEDVIPTLDVQAETIAPVEKSKIGEVAKAVSNVSLGRINRDMPTNALKAMMMANRSVELPYKAEAPSRQYNYNEIDVSPQLNRIAAGTNQQLQNVNMNTSQGQAVANAIQARKLGLENEVVARTSQQNRQIRNQVDNANVSALNQMDLRQEQFNTNYVDGVQQVLANRDRAKVQQADYLDQMIRERNSTDNGITMINMANPNYRIDPVTGEVQRTQTKLGDRPKAKFGLKKKK